MGGLKVFAAYGVGGCALGGLGLSYASSLAASWVPDMNTGSSSNHQVNQAVASVTSQQTADNFDLALGAAMTGWALSNAPVFRPMLAPRTPPPPGLADNPAGLRHATPEEMRLDAPQGCRPVQRHQDRPERRVGHARRRADTRSRWSATRSSR
jgi:hypothetical protein